MKNAKKKTGFTLIELIVVIVILGIIALISVPAYVNMTTNAKDGALKGQLGTMRAAVALAYANSVTSSGSATYPSTISSNMFSDSTIPVDPFLSSSTVVTGNPITFTDTGGWRYNPTTGEVRSNVASKHTL